ncbi:hypothetical protein ACOSP7_033006 [Xanthoceras sorbifolium]|uniref:Histidine-containing phosphotransfer protein n=1 Tax=Xanthoceras sorbifolium TaxID=99658 RepID=A0ABQ8H385_9ROSI|nr:hypothetical protein JRO89_XS14G0013500 [Xanthoceras sorbifolium]
MAEKQALSQQLIEIIRSMEADGVMDHRFRQVYTLKEVNGPFFFADLVSTFCSDSQITIRDMSLVLENPIVNYYDLEELCMKIKGGSSCIGACQMAHACGALRQAVNEKSKERCAAAVEAIKIEYLRLEGRMSNVVQLERRIDSQK